MLDWLWNLLLDQKGQEDDGQDADPGDAGEEGSPKDGGQDGGGGQGEEPPATPAYGEFGDTPQTLEEANALLQKVYDAHSKIVPEFDTLKGKTSATERNLSLTRKALEQSGVRAIPTEDGGIRLEVVDKKPTTRQLKFNDTHKSLFDQKVLDAINLLIEDKFDESFSTRETQAREGYQRRIVYDRFYDQATDLMFSYFPQLDGKWQDNKSTNTMFDKEFHDAVSARVQEKFSNSKGQLTNPQGELLAALEIAKERGISTKMIEKAKQEGFQAGKAGKKILGPAGQGGGTKAVKGKLGFAEYDKLSPEEKEKYDRQEKGL